MNKKKNQSTKILNILICVVIAVFIALFLFGLTSEMLGSHCSGFMGSEGSCVENYAVLPFVVIGVPLLILLSLSLILKKYSVKETPAPTRKRK